jgi:hypothetical protein
MWETRNGRLSVGSPSPVDKSFKFYLFLAFVFDIGTGANNLINWVTGSMHEPGIVVWSRLQF